MNVNYCRKRRVVLPSNISTAGRKACNKLIKLTYATVKIPFPLVVSNEIKERKNSSWDSETNATWSLFFKNNNFLNFNLGTLDLGCIDVMSRVGEEWQGPYSFEIFKFHDFP